MTVSNIANTQLQTSMQRLSSMQRINSAADDAAGLAIAERMSAQIRGIDQGTRNVLDMQSLVHTAEGGLEGVGNSLIRIRELSIQAMNGVLTDQDRQNIQFEIDQLLDHIDRTAGTAQFNTQNLLDGTFEDRHTAADAAGRGPSVSIRPFDTAALGMQGFNVVTGPIELDRIDRALSQVAGQRAELGALSNRFDYTVESNQIASLNLAASRSRIADLDAALGFMQLNSARILQQVQIQVQAMRQSQLGNHFMMLA